MLPAICAQPRNLPGDGRTTCSVGLIMSLERRSSRRLRSLPHIRLPRRLAVRKHGCERIQNFGPNQSFIVASDARLNLLAFSEPIASRYIALHLEECLRLDLYRHDVDWTLIRAPHMLAVHRSTTR